MESLLPMWAIFDGDNTLWATEALYDTARLRLCELLAPFGVPFGSADTYQRERDAQLHATMGYSVDRFPRSFLETAAHFVPSEAALIQRAKEVGEQVFIEDPAVAPEVDKILQRLTPHYRLALLTAGEEAVQRRRLDVFARAHHFDRVQIVPRKDRHVLQQFLHDLGADASTTWMIGDSLRSDIHPALELGLNAIHLNVPNWHPVETAALALPIGAHQVDNLGAAADLLLAAAKRH